MSIELVMPSKHLISVIPFSSYLQSFPASGSFPRSQLFASDAQRIGVSASASALPINIQDWFPLGLTGLFVCLFVGTWVFTLFFLYKFIYFNWRLITLQYWLGWFSGSPRNSQEFSPTPQFKSINSLALSFLYSPTLTSIHDYWKNHNFD